MSRWPTKRRCFPEKSGSLVRYVDRVQEALGFEVFVDLRRGEGGIAPEIQSCLSSLVANDYGLRHAFPVIGAVKVAGMPGGIGPVWGHAR